MPLPERLQRQNRQLKELSQFASRQSPFFIKRFKEAGVTDVGLSGVEALRSLPLLTRRDLQTYEEEIYCKQMPSSHAPRIKVKTSGSSGEPVELYRTAATQLFWLANSLRDHVWYQRDFSGRLAAIRANLSNNQLVRAKDWGEPVNLLYQSGPALGIPISSPIPEQAQHLAQFDPHYLLVYPNALAALLDEFRTKRIKLDSLWHVRSIGETLSCSLRDRVREELGVPIMDVYSAQEVGILAIQCPQSDLYHVMDENLIVEVLDQHGNQCGEGETGRIVVTDLSNYATPVFRYDLADYAQVGGACPCGRTLPTLKAFKGRERHMVVVDGEKRWPLVGFREYRHIAPVVQYQIVQKSTAQLEVRLVTEVPLTAEQENKLGCVIRKALEHEFGIEFKYYEGRIPLPASGKFEEFICEL